MENLKASMEHLNETTSSLRGIIQESRWRARESAANDGFGKESRGRFAAAIADARKTVQSASDVTRSHKRKGLARHAFEERELAKDLRALISNLRATEFSFIGTARRKAKQRARAEQRSEPRPAQNQTLMTPLFTLNLLRVLFVTFCATIGGMVSAEMLDTRLPGRPIGLFSVCSSCLSIDCSKAFLCAHFRPPRSACSSDCFSRTCSWPRRSCIINARDDQVGRPA